MSDLREWSTFKRLIWLKATLLSGAASIIKTVTGVSPISLTHAISRAMLSLTQTGKCEQRNCPEGYNQVEYLQSSGAQYIDTGVKATQATKIEVRFMFHAASDAAGSGCLFGSRQSSRNKSFIVGASGGKVQAGGTISGQVGAAVSASASYTIGEWCELELDDLGMFLNGEDYTLDAGTGSFETPQNIKLFGFDNNGTVGMGVCRIARCRIWSGGTLQRDFVAAKNASNVYGLWDKKNGQFYASATETAFTGGDEVTKPYRTTPIDIVCNNGALRFNKATGTVYAEGAPEVITLSGKNLFDHNSFPWAETSTLVYTPLYVGDGTFTMSSPDYPVVSGVTNLFFLAGSVSSGANSNNNGVWSAQSRTVTAVNGYVTIANRTAGGSGLSQNNKPVGFHWQIEKGDTATDFQPYVAPQTASAANLFAIADYADDQDVVSGLITRECGVQVFDGTERWTTDTNAGGGTILRAKLTGYIKDESGGRRKVLCTHFSYSNGNEDGAIFIGAQTGTLFFESLATDISDVNAWKAFLAAQYGAGTPVIIVYPLAEETTETASAQPLNTAQGTNTVSVVSEVDPVTLKAEYRGTE